MKRSRLLLALFAALCMLGGCKTKEQVIYLGNNAIIERVSEQEGGIYVSDSPDERLFGELCFIECSEAAIMTVDFKTNEITELTLAGLQKGDMVTIDLTEEEMKRVKDERRAAASRVQRMQTAAYRAQKQGKIPSPDSPFAKWEEAPKNGNKK